MIYTSYFAKIKSLPKICIPVSIARFTPKGINIPAITELAPTSEILMDYKEDNNKAKYIRRYNEEILGKLSTNKILELISDKANVYGDFLHSDNINIVLCCFEKSEDFCHRHLVADYFEKQGIRIPEVNDEVLMYMNTQIGKTATFTGRRPKALFGYKNESLESYTLIMKEVYNIIEELYKNKGVTNFITGGAQGFDQLAFRAVHKLKKTYPKANIRNVLYLPCKGQSDKWADTGLFSKTEYNTILKSADEIRYISNDFTPSCLNDRNKAMVDSSDYIIGLRENDINTKFKGGTANALKYANEHGKNIIELNYDLADFKNTLRIIKDDYEICQLDNEDYTVER